MSIVFILISLIFLQLTLYLFGSNFVRVFLKNKNKKILNLENNSILVFIGFFYLSNILFLINFFLPIKNYIYIPVIFLVIFIERKKILNFLFKNYVSIICSFILLTSAYTNNPSFDSYRYHFFSQQLIKYDKIQFGISNFDFSYGIISIFEYISSILWVGNNYFFIQLINLIFIASFLNFLYDCFNTNNLLLKNISIFILLIGVLDNFGFGGGRNGFLFIQEVGKFDSSYAVIFILTTLYFIFLLKSKNKNLGEYIEFDIFLILLTLLLQIRSFSYTYLFFVLIYFFYVKKIDYFLKRKYFILVNFTWIIKTLITTSCIVYPVEITCLNNVSWSFYNQAKYFSKIATTNNRDASAYMIDLFDFSWVLNKWWMENQSYIYNIIFTILIIIGIKFLFKKKEKEKSTLIFVNLILLFNIFSWFLLYPNYRFLSGVVVCCYISLFITYLHPYISLNKIVNNQKKFLLLLFVCAILIPRISTYIFIANNFELNFYNRYEIQKTQFSKKLNSYGLESNDGYCYQNVFCSNSNQFVNVENKFGYVVYIPINDDLYR